MKIITVLMGNVYGFPPVLSLLHAFEDIGIQSVFITTCSDKKIYKELPKTTIEQLDFDYSEINNPAFKMLHLHNWKMKLWKFINKHYNEKSIIWVITDVTIKILGNELIKKKYVIHLLELSENITYYHKASFLKMNKEVLGNKAEAIVVPEYNRAHIIKAWWKLKKLPFIVPNKPYFSQNIGKYAEIENKVANETIKKLENKKIILYQGIIDMERPLGSFIDAVDEYGGKYAFVVMSGDKNIYEKQGSKNFHFIPFVAPPDHLQITSHAYIGVLSYIPTYSSGYSPLNSLYCAPNKTFEYSMFGIPMLGNDNPGLKFLFETQKCGICFEEFSKEKICMSIDRIENSYSILAKNAYDYYDSCNYIENIKNILSRIF